MGNPLWHKAILAMHMDGAAGSTVFTDLKGSTFVAVGLPVIAADSNAFGGAAAFFNGSSYLSTAAADKFALSARDFHLSMRFLIASPSALQSGARKAVLLSIGTGSTIDFRLSLMGDASTTGTGLSMKGVAAEVNRSMLISSSEWHHVSFDRWKGSAYISLDGELKSVFAYSGSMGSASRQLTIGGCDYAAAGILNGYIDDLLFIDGAALNTTSFVPPTAPFEDAFEAMMQPMAGPRVAVSAEVAVGRAARMEGPARFRDMEHEGAGRIIGTTKNVGDPDYPVSRRVRLFRKRDGVLAREMWSDAAGNYQFNHVRADVEYVITSHDHTGLYNAVIADSIIPELIP